MTLNCLWYRGRVTLVCPESCGNLVKKQNLVISIICFVPVFKERLKEEEAETTYFETQMWVPELVHVVNGSSTAEVCESHSSRWWWSAAEAEYHVVQQWWQVAAAMIHMVWQRRAAVKVNQGHASCWWWPPGLSSTPG